MKSKEEVFNEQYLKFISGMPEVKFQSVDKVGEAERSATYAMMQEYATQQTAAITAERDEYRKALAAIYACDGMPGFDAAEIANKILAKYPQQ